MFDVRRPPAASPSSASAKQCRSSGTQKSRLNRAELPPPRFFERAGERARRPRPPAPAARIASWRRRRSPGSRRWRAGSGSRAVRKGIEFHESFQHWFSRPVSSLRAGTRRSRRRRGRRTSSIHASAARALGSSSRDESRVAGPALVLVEQHQEERRGVGGAVVGRVRPLAEGGDLAEAQLVQDLAGLLVAEAVDSVSLAARRARAASSRRARGRTAGPGSS